MFCFATAKIRVGMGWLVAVLVRENGESTAGEACFAIVVSLVLAILTLVVVIFIAKVQGTCILLCCCKNKRRGGPVDSIVQPCIAAPDPGSISNHFLFVLPRHKWTKAFVCSMDDLFPNNEDDNDDDDHARPDKNQTKRPAMFSHPNKATIVMGSLNSSSSNVPNSADYSQNAQCSMTPHCSIACLHLLLPVPRHEKLASRVVLHILKVTITQFGPVHRHGDSLFINMAIRIRLDRCLFVEHEHLWAFC